MKIFHPKTYYLSFILLFLVDNANSQNIGLDTTFGTNGTVFDSSIGTFPKVVFFENNKYFFVFNEGFCSKNYNGSSDINFGTNGKTFFNNSTETFLTKGAKFQNGFIYIYGQVSTNSNPNNKNIFLAKVSDAGIFDNTFGNNGFVKLDLGSNEEIINDITINVDGKILIIGDKDAVIFVSKMNANGTLDTSFNTIGYKQFPLNTNEISKGGSIYNDLGNYILVGSSTYPSNTFDSSKYLVFFKMDSNGNLISNYGTNGLKSLILATPGGTGYYTIINSKLISNNLYIIYHFSGSFINQYKKIVKYNLATEAFTELNYVPTEDFDFVLDANQNIYVTGTERCSSINSSFCGRKFQLSKKIPNGSVDTSFNTTGTFNFQFFPNGISPDDRSTVLYRHADGKILVGGYAGDTFSMMGFGMIRVMDSSLPSPNFDIQPLFTISPNPANQELNIDLKEGITIIKMEIIDANGRLILSKNSNFQKVNIENLQHGLYFLKIKTEDTASVLKFIKK